MSTSTSFSPPAKNISSCVRPGVLEVRASALRPLSALIRLDLPTLERPANAISVPCMAGSRSSEPAAAVNCQSPANSLRPVSISSGVNGVAAMAGFPIRHSGLDKPRDAGMYLPLGFLLFSEQRFEVVEQLDLGAMFVHDDALLGHRQRVVPCPIDHEPGRKACQ